MGAAAQIKERILFLKNLFNGNSILVLMTIFYSDDLFIKVSFGHISMVELQNIYTIDISFIIRSSSIEQVTRSNLNYPRLSIAGNSIHMISGPGITEHFISPDFKFFYICSLYLSCALIAKR
jgi:hypothetical protein